MKTELRDVFPKGEKEPAPSGLFRGLMCVFKFYFVLIILYYGLNSI